MAVGDDLDEHIQQDRLKSWLRSAGLAKYFDTLVDNEFDSLRAVSQISAADLVDLGITKIGARRKFLSSVKTLKGEITEISWDDPYPRPGIGPQPDQHDNSLAHAKDKSAHYAVTRATTSLGLRETNEPALEPEKPAGPRPASAASSRRPSSGIRTKSQPGSRPTSGSRSRFPPVGHTQPDEDTTNRGLAWEDKDDDLVKV